MLMNSMRLLVLNQSSFLYDFMLSCPLLSE